MTKEDTYRPAVLPSEAVMMPATDAADNAPSPAAQQMPAADDPTMRPAQRPGASYALERLRNRHRIANDVRWVSTNAVSIGSLAPPTPPAMPMERPAPPQQPEARQRPTTISQGAALQTLMRSAARGQHSPAPMLTPAPQSMAQTMSGSLGQPQMRGALRQAVRNAQQPQLIRPGAQAPTGM